MKMSVENRILLSIALVLLVPAYLVPVRAQSIENPFYTPPYEKEINGTMYLCLNFFASTMDSTSPMPFMENKGDSIYLALSPNTIYWHAPADDIRAKPPSDLSQWTPIYAGGYITTSPHGVANGPSHYFRSSAIAAQVAICYPLAAATQTAAKATEMKQEERDIFWATENARMDANATARAQTEETRVALIGTPTPRLETIDASDCTEHPIPLYPATKVLPIPVRGWFEPGQGRAYWLDVMQPQTELLQLSEPVYIIPQFLSPNPNADLENMTYNITFVYGGIPNTTVKVCKPKATAPLPTPRMGTNACEIIYVEPGFSRVKPCCQFDSTTYNTFCREDTMCIRGIRFDEGDNLIPWDKMDTLTVEPLDYDAELRQPDPIPDWHLVHKGDIIGMYHGEGIDVSSHHTTGLARLKVCYLPEADEQLDPGTPPSDEYCGTFGSSGQGNYMVNATSKIAYYSNWISEGSGHQIPPVSEVVSALPFDWRYTMLNVPDPAAEIMIFEPYQVRAITVTLQTGGANIDTTDGLYKWNYVAYRNSKTTRAQEPLQPGVPYSVSYTKEQQAWFDWFFIRATNRGPDKGPINPITGDWCVLVDPKVDPTPTPTRTPAGTLTPTLSPTRTYTPTATHTPNPNQLTATAMRENATSAALTGTPTSIPSITPTTTPPPTAQVPECATYQLGPGEQLDLTARPGQTYIWQDGSTVPHHRQGVPYAIVAGQLVNQSIPTGPSQPWPYQNPTGVWTPLWDSRTLEDAVITVCNAENSDGPSTIPIATTDAIGTPGFPIPIVPTSPPYEQTQVSLLSTIAAGNPDPNSPWTGSYGVATAPAIGEIPSNTWNVATPVVGLELPGINVPTSGTLPTLPALVGGDGSLLGGTPLVDTTGVAGGVGSIIGEIGTPFAVTDEMSSTYDIPAAQTAVGNIVEHTPALEWVSLVNPYHPAWNEEGCVLWSLSPVLTPFLPLFGIVLVVLLLKLILYVIRWIILMIELIPGQ